MTRRRDPAPRFLAIPNRILTHRTYRTLPAAEKAVLWHLAQCWTGPKDDWNNNGAIGYGCRAAAAIGISKDRAAKALKTLTAVGLIEPTRESWFRPGGRILAGEWRLTFQPTTEQAPTWDRPIREGGTLGFSQKADERQIKVYHQWLNCAAYQRLTSPGKVTLLELMRRFDGGNNGAIAFGCDDHHHVGLSRKTTARALLEVRDHGFIVETMAADPSQEQRRRWRLTMYAWDGKKATITFLKWAAQNHFTCPSGDTETPSPVLLVTLSEAPPEAADPPKTGQNPKDSKGFLANSVSVTTRTGDPNLSVTTRTHLETMCPPDPSSEARGAHVARSVKTRTASAGSVLTGSGPNEPSAIPKRPSRRTSPR
jgi:hypothetical protein